MTKSGIHFLSGRQKVLGYSPNQFDVGERGCHTSKLTILLKVKGKSLQKTTICHATCGA